MLFTSPEKSKMAYQKRYTCLKYILIIFTLQIITIYLFLKMADYFPNLKNAILTTNSQDNNIMQSTSYKSLARHKYKHRENWTNVKRLQKVDAKFLHDKWIVITTINYPTEDIKKLAAISDWNIVVVGDTKTPKDWRYRNCIFLDVQKQLSLGYRTTKLLKFKSYARKNIGYLYAIHHGAKVIYETDDDNSPTNGKIEFDQNSSLDYLVYASFTREVVNPYAHFGQSTIWPRGYPLDRIADKPLHKFRRCRRQRSLVQQGVVNGDPDVDAIYRLTRKDADIDLNVTFDSTAEPVLLPKGIIAPYNSQNTLYLFEAFWGLLLPQTTAFRVCDIWRGYWAQRLLWDIDGHLSFFPPNAAQFRNAHNYLDDFIDEKQLYHDASRFVKFLIRWKSDKSHFFDRILDLSYAMVQEKLWGEDDVELVRFWLMDLVSVGYKPPEIRDKSSICQEKAEIVPPNEQISSYLRSGKMLKKIKRK